MTLNLMKSNGMCVYHGMDTEIVPYKHSFCPACINQYDRVHENDIIWRKLYVSRHSNIAKMSSRVHAWDEEKAGTLGVVRLLILCVLQDVVQTESKRVIAAGFFFFKEINKNVMIMLCI